MMGEKRYEFVVVEQDYAPGNSRWIATLGDYDLDAPCGEGQTPAEAIIEWLEVWEDQLP